MKMGSLKITSSHNFPYVRNFGHVNMAPRLNFILSTPFVIDIISETFVILQEIQIIIIFLFCKRPIYLQ